MNRLNFDFDNIGGICRLFAIPPGSFLRIREDFTEGLKYLECCDRASIIDIPVISDDSFIFDEDQTFGDAGDAYSINISGVIPKNQLENQKDIEILERGEWYVLCQDNNGIVRLAGDEDVKLKFITKKTSGIKAAALNKISFTFSCLQADPSQMITLDNMDLL